MNDEYKILRAAIYSNEDEMQRFRQLIVNSVMATDIADKDQKVFRNARWDRAFHEIFEENEQDSINRKTTIAIEHLIQASDVAHTMQHVRMHMHMLLKLLMRIGHVNLSKLSLLFLMFL
jgi:hypothetical protein